MIWLLPARRTHGGGSLRPGSAAADHALARVGLAPSGLDAQRYWAAGTAPILEIIAALDPFHSPDQWGDLRAQLGARVTTTVIEDASHALFPEQPDAVAGAVIDYLRTL